MTQEKKAMTIPYFGLIVIVASVFMGWIIYHFILGAPGNFEGGNNENKALAGNYLGIMYKGGVIVPLLIGILLIVFTFAIERFITIRMARGNGAVEPFVRKVRGMLSNGQMDEAIAECDKQKGSVANVIRSGLLKYSQVEKETNLDKEAKVAAIQKSLEEATALELPMLSKNLVIISTCASISTLVGLLGTVLGMIKAFAALAQAGAPDAIGLANGISEALINTMLGIGAAALGIVFYNLFNNLIDSLTYGMDEAGFSIVQTYSATHKERE
ncbi:MAG TPA: MotA/TolQ/ExbB proton channel family protein [Bacteroidia bacterium]|jgi:biopolymer transport protein ExbB|nr:MotA/TolQ/ExbB proton channel family protein [Bacteroidia bacterium]